MAGIKNMGILSSPVGSAEPDAEALGQADRIEPAALTRAAFQVLETPLFLVLQHYRLQAFHTLLETFNAGCILLRHTLHRAHFTPALIHI